MATQYTLTGSFTAITEESGTIQNIGYEAAELVSTTNAVEGEGIELLPGEKRTFNGAMKARSKGDTSTKVNVVDFKDAAGGGGSSYTLPVATGSTLGGVKSSSATGDVTVNDDGTMTVNGGSAYELPTASASTLGGIKVGSRLSIDGDGVLSASDQSYTLPTASASTKGGVKVGSGLSIDADGVLSSSGSAYTLPTASASTLGGIKVGDRLSIDGDGVLSASDQSYTLPTASASTLGGIKVGDRLSIDANGVLSAADQSYTLPTASAATLGGVKVGSGLSIDGNGVLSSSGGGGSDFQPHIYVTTLKTGCTVTCTRNGVSATYTVDSETGVIDFAIPSFGDWSVTCAKDGRSRTDVVNISEIKIYYLTITNGYLYGYRIKKTESDPTTRVEYLYDAVGMTPAHMDFTNSVFDYGDWGDLWFVKNNKPCMLKSDGTVDYYLDPDDYTKKADGTASDVANASYDGNAMSEIPLVWVKRWEDETYEYEVVCDFQYDNDYKAYAHTKEDGTIADKFYFSMFGGSGSAAKIRSLSGQSLSQSLTTANQIAGATANGSGWYIHSWSQRELLRTLCVLIGRSTDTQSVFGSGNCRSASSASGMLTTGTLNDKGQFFGYNNSTNQVKVFHVEKLWGDQWDRVAGLINNSGNIYVKMTPERDGYRVTDVTGYTNTGITLSGTSGGYISQCQCGDFGIIPKVISGSGTTYYADGGWFNNGQLDYLLAGAGAADAAAIGGAFTFEGYYAPADVYWSIGCGLSYL